MYLYQSCLQLADVRLYLVVHEEGDVCGLEAGVRGEDGVVGLDDGGRHLRRGVHHKLQLGLARELGVEAVHQQRGEAGARPATERVEHDEPLKLPRKEETNCKQ